MKNTGERFVPSERITETAIEHWHRYVSVLPYVKNKKVLDIASGSGYGSFLLAEEAKEVIGIDIDEESINYSKTNYKKDNLSYKQGSAINIPINGLEVFDVIISYETIEHLNEEDQRKFLYEIKRLLKKDGLFVLSTPNKKTYTDLSPSAKNPFHIKEFYVEEYKTFLEKYFSNITILGQKIYLTSFLWNLNEIKNTYTEEYSLEKNETKKEPLYFIAFCSNSNITKTENTLLLDTNDKSINLIIKEVILKKNKEIDTLKNSISWKITTPLRYLKKILKLDKINFTQKNNP